jgi:hypothetical protein
VVNSEPFAEPLPESGNELGAAIRYDCQRQAMVTENFPDKHVGKVLGVGISTARDQVTLLRQSVDYDPDRIAAFR